MDRMVEPDWSAAPRRREWDWLWSTLTFSADVLSWPPQDNSGWCHWPFQATPINDQPPQIPNKFGPAMHIRNEASADWSKGWLWQDATGATGSNPAWFNWTLAFGFDHRTLNSGQLRIVHIWCGIFNIHFLAAMDTSGPPFSPRMEWITRAGTLVSDEIAGWARYSPHTCVITTRSQVPKETKIYINGIPHGSASWGDPAAVIQDIYVGCDYLQKQNVCLGGTVGPLLMSKHVWSEAEVLQWHSDPWGYIRGDLHPIIPPPFVLPPPRWTCVVQGRDLPADAEGRDLPADAEGRDLPAAAEGRDLPAGAEGRDLPADLGARDLPAAAEGRDLPAAAEGRDLPAETEGRTVSGPEDSGDRGTDVEDHPAPRTTDVDGQSC